MTPPVALTVAGSDCGGGAGIQADIKTFAAHGVYGMSVVTAITAQNSHGVRDVFPIPSTMVSAQLASIMDDVSVGAVKVGMLATVEAADVVARCARGGMLPNLVLDPVLRSSSGFGLSARTAVERLLPYATVVTPNAEEASALVGSPVSTVDEMAAAARQLAASGAACVVVTGGDLSGDEASDVAWVDGTLRILRAPRVETANTHGTGCTFSSAIAARLARGDTVPVALSAAKAYVSRALAGAASWRLGTGRGPLDHTGFGLSNQDFAVTKGARDEDLHGGFPPGHPGAVPGGGAVR